MTLPASRSRLRPPARSARHLPPLTSPCRSPEASHRPRFLAEAHIPEHPLVPACRPEVLVHPQPLDRRQLWPELVRDRDDVADLGVELLAAIGVDPLLVPGIRRALAEQVLADLTVDPVAGQYGADTFGVRAAPRRRQQVTVVG